MVTWVMVTGVMGLSSPIFFDAGDGLDDEDGMRVALAEDGVFAVEFGLTGPSVMKNCEPPVPGPALAMARRPSRSKRRPGANSSGMK